MYMWKISLGILYYMFLNYKPEFDTLARGKELPKSKTVAIPKLGMKIQQADLPKAKESEYVRVRILHRLTSDQASEIIGAVGGDFVCEIYARRIRKGQKWVWEDVVAPDDATPGNSKYYRYLSRDQVTRNWKLAPR